MSPYAERRARLLAQMEPGSVAVIATAPEVLRNGDSDYPYRHDSSFYYLTGFTEPEAVLLLLAPRGTAPAQSILFCREKNIEHEIWEGYRYGPEAARAEFGLDFAYPIGQLDEQMTRQLSNATALYCSLARNTTLDAQVMRWLESVRRMSRSGITAPSSVRDLLPIIDEMRLLKDEGEQAIMLRAGVIAGGAHERAMRATKPGMFEYEIEAELLYEFRRHGALFPAYTPIVASGANACVLHYNTNNRRTEDGDLVLIDAGCEFEGYASDITRTFPVNGRFSGPQRELYELVLAAQEAAFQAIVPGRQYSGIHEAAVRVLVQGMLDTGLLKGSVDEAIASKSYAQFYMHGTGHWLGMDVHDVGLYRDVSQHEKPSRLIQPGMALTVEPGIYVRPAAGVPEQYWNIGIRIEDDVIVTQDGYRLLTASAPKSIADIEFIMKGGA
ncbi:Xaa-Pro aminopeptidase [Pseudoduganella sp. UC29_106]|uniref:Xaa-Pro aminopeptidase n=1 Tax=Pseudoduganella sp. UC29_106 TaxID=3374553 RepID=UPI0037581BBD